VRFQKKCWPAKTHVVTSVFEIKTCLHLLFLDSFWVKISRKQSLLFYLLITT
jgi:hypothetical protein